MILKRSTGCARRFNFFYVFFCRRFSYSAFLDVVDGDVRCKWRVGVILNVCALGLSMYCVGIVKWKSSSVVLLEELWSARSKVVRLRAKMSSKFMVVLLYGLVSKYKCASSSESDRIALILV